jgi:hypothetical protein
MTMRSLSLALAVLVGLAAPAPAQQAADRTFAPGRVGAIVKGRTKPEDLARIYGADNVKLATIHAPGGGEESPGAFISQGTDDALELVFSDDSKRIVSVGILGKNWTTKEGLRLGASLDTVERINGRPFKFYGFGFDYGGQVTESGPKLKGFTIFLKPTTRDEKLLEQFTGEKQFSSRHPAIKRLSPEVMLIQVDFTPN